MGTLSDRIVMTIIVVTAVVGLAGYLVTVMITEWSDWYVRNVLPILVGVFFVAIVFAVWEGLDLLD